MALDQLANHVILLLFKGLKGALLVLGARVIVVWLVAAI